MFGLISPVVYRRWMLAICFCIVAIVVVGGVTRLTHSGLSMVEWRPIYGIFPPISHGQWMTVFEKYQHFPEYKQLHVGMSLFEFKKLFFWEYLHRVLARILGLIIILPFFFFALTGQLTAKMKRQGFIMCFLVLLQGLMGWLMVKSGLVDRPDVSHFRLALHLLLAFVLFEYVMWTYWEAEDGVNDGVELGYLPSLSVAWGFVALVVVQIVYGAFVAGLDAGFGYNTFPKMNGYWIPPTATSQSPFWSNFVSNPVTVQFVHRVLAVWLVIRTWLLGVLVLRATNPALRRAFFILCVALCVQIVLGVLTLIYVVPIPLAILHQLGGLTVLTSAVHFAYRLNWLHGGED